MTSSQVVLADLQTSVRVLAAADGDEARMCEEYPRTRRALLALGALLGVAEGAAMTAADVRRAQASQAGACSVCGEKAPRVPSAGFGGAVRQICGACGHDAAA